MRKFRLYYDKEKEEAWLNKMTGQGWAMTGFFLGVFTFEPCEPGKYTYQVDLPEISGMFVRRGEARREYIEFVEATGAEYVCSWAVWVIFRKETEKGEFRLYTDADSQIRLYRRIRLLFLIFFLYGVGISVTNTCSFRKYISESLASGTWNFFTDGDFFWLPSLAASYAVMVLFLFLTLRLTGKIHRLRQEKIFP